MDGFKKFLLRGNVVDLAIAVVIGAAFGSIVSAVVNGVISVPIMLVMMLMAVRPDIMGKFVISAKLKLLGWLATAMMALAVVAMFLTM